MQLPKIFARRSPKAPVEKPVILIIADISGYTEFMLSTQTALLHGQLIINELIQAIIQQVKIPLKVAKLEGDAIFLYAINSDDNTRQKIGSKLVEFFDVFSHTLKDLAGEHTDCNCGACANIRGLRLKMVVHTGQALLYHIGDFLELAGVDVIIAHRLLKNSLNLREYILMTESAYQHIPIPGERAVQQHEETYNAVGCLNLFVYPR